MEMVALEELEKEDYQTIRTLLRNHFRFTGSLKALEILQHWDTHKKSFVKVMPTEYKAILEKQKQQVTAA